MDTMCIICPTSHTRHGLKADESVFLDDTLVNVKAAEEQGIHGIHFLTKEQAEEELRKLGVDC